MMGSWSTIRCALRAVYPSTTAAGGHRRSIHAGQVCVADGSELARPSSSGSCANDPAMGVSRHTDAGYDQAAEVATQRGVRVPMAP